MSGELQAATNTLTREHYVRLVSGEIILNVFGRHTSGNLLHFYWDIRSGWKSEDMTAVYGARCDLQQLATWQIEGDPVAINFVSGLTPTEHVFGRQHSGNISGNLIHYYWDAQSGWAREDLTEGPGTAARAAPGSPPVDLSAKQIVGNPVAINVLDISNHPTLHVFGRTASDTVAHYFWKASVGWLVENLTDRFTSRANTISTDPVVFILYDGFFPRLHVYGRHSPENDVIEYSEGASAWDAMDLTATFGVPGTQIAGNIVGPSGTGLAAELMGRAPNGNIIRYCAGTC